VTLPPGASFPYDTLNRPSTKAAPSEPTVTYSYDLANRPIGFADISASITAPASGAVAAMHWSTTTVRGKIRVLVHHKDENVT
jgi:hypothetical protein